MDHYGNAAHFVDVQVFDKNPVGWILLDADKQSDEQDLLAIDAAEDRIRDIILPIVTNAVSPSVMNNESRKLKQERRPRSFGDQEVPSPVIAVYCSWHWCSPYGQRQMDARVDHFVESILRQVDQDIREEGARRNMQIIVIRANITKDCWRGLFVTMNKAEGKSA